MLQLHQTRRQEYASASHNLHTPCVRPKYPPSPAAALRAQRTEKQRKRKEGERRQQKKKSLTLAFETW